MKKFIKDLFVGLFILTVLIVAFIACGYTEKGDFKSAVPYLLIEGICCIIVAIIAHYNSKKEAKAAKAKRNARKKANQRAKANAEKAAKAAAYRDDTMRFVSSIPTPQSPETRAKKYDERLKACEELALVGLDTLID